MKFLAIDASSCNLSIHIRCTKDKTVDFNRRMKFGASRLVPGIAKHLEKAGLSLKDIDVLVVGKGPGSFTGLRISFSVIKAFSIALSKPVIEVSSFFSCAYILRKRAEKIGVVSDARRGLIYLGVFKSRPAGLVKIGQEKLAGLDELLKSEPEVLFTTYDAALRQKILNLNPKINFYHQDIYPRAKYLLPEAESYYNKGKFTPVEKLEPLYLHPKTCQIRK